jgi:hypothetical protein
MKKNFSACCQISAILIGCTAFNVHAEITKPPQLIPDGTQATYQRAMAKVMTIAPKERTRDTPVTERQALYDGEKGCSMTVAPLPDKRSESRTGRVDMTVIVNQPMICGH